MRWIPVAATAALTIAATVAAEDKEKSSNSAAAEAKIHTAVALQWADAPPRLPRGGKMTVLDGDPDKPGTFITRLKRPAGYKIMTHTHPVAERVTVIAGSVYISTGDKPDEAAARKLSAGDFVVFPKGSKHSAWTTEECAIQIQSEGPFEMEYANPAHDPRQQKK